MILSELVRFAHTQLDLPPFGYGPIRVNWLVKLTTKGEFAGLQFLGVATGSKLSFLAPTLSRSYSINPKLLVDTSEYVFGNCTDLGRSTRAKHAHKAFMALTRACAIATGNPSVKAVLRFLEASASSLHELKSLDPRHVVAFDVDGALPTECESVRTFWASYVGRCGAPMMNCLVTGQIVPVVRRLPHKLKGVPHGQSSGTTLVSANAPAFEHYGLKNTLNAPISLDAAEAISQALNFLIVSPAHHVRVGNWVYLFWARRKQPDIPWWLLEAPDIDRVSRFLGRLAAKGSTGTSADKLFVLALSATGGRAAVRDWFETSFPDTLAHVGAWFEAQWVVGAYGQAARPLSLRSLARVVDLADRDEEAFSILYANLLQHALRGGKLNATILAQVVGRNRSARNVTHGRAALTKLVLTSQGVPMDGMHALNEHSLLMGADERAYACGRLLAVLEKVQRVALGRASASLVDPYYGSASTIPARTIPALLRRAELHLRRIKRNRPSTAYVLGQTVERLYPYLAKAPATLTLTQQGLFGLGYYHQRAAERAGRLSARVTEGYATGGERRDLHT